MGLVRMFLLVALLGALGTAALRVLLFRPMEHLTRADLRPRLPVEQPFHVLISCEVHKQSGEAVYGGVAIEYWADGLEPIYLEGALARAQRRFL
jgi:hypothetical protein